jgi:hypothetical protein
MVGGLLLSRSPTRTTRLTRPRRSTSSYSLFVPAAAALDFREHRHCLTNTHASYHTGAIPSSAFADGSSLLLYNARLLPILRSVLITSHRALVVVLLVVKWA